MTTLTLPIPSRHRSEAQGPHTLNPTAERSFFLQVQDLPIGTIADYSPGTLLLRFTYDDDDGMQELSEDDLAHGLLLSKGVDSLKLLAIFQKSKRRLVAFRFVDFDPSKVTVNHLTGGVAAIVRGLGSPEMERETGPLTPQQILTIKGVAVLCIQLLPRIIEDLRSDLKRQGRDR